MSEERVELPAGTPAEKRCEVCMVGRTEHDRLLRGGEVHHRFSEHGELVHESQRRPQVITRSDLALRMALIDAGVITYGQLARAEAKLREVPAAEGRGSGGDHQDRSPEGP